jgi:hypothetical protein
MYINIIQINLFYRLKQIMANRKRLILIVDCIILCDKQEIVLRGHRDFGPINFCSKLKII